MRLALNKKSAQKQKPRLQTTASRKPLFQGKQSQVNTDKNLKCPIIVRSSVMGFFICRLFVVSVKYRIMHGYKKFN
jgi:hypothetical protein